MYFLEQRLTGALITIHSSDIGYFSDIVNSGEVFNTENKFRVIKDKTEIKKILDEKYSSRHRTEEYTAGLPSATVISSGLFPYDLDPKSPHNKIPLLKWNNDISVEDFQAQKIKNKLSTDSGTFIHEILEYAIQDRNTRLFDKAKKLPEYIEQVCEDPNIIKMIDNFANRKEYFVQMATKTLSKFFANEISNIDPVFNEIFIKTKGLQGAIDLVNFKNNNLYISDFKTSKKSMSYNQVEGKGYLRQLWLYGRMLLKEKYITKQEYDNLKYQIYFFNWNSCKSAIYEFPQEEVYKSKAYCKFILNWFYKMKDIDLTADDVI